MQVFFDQYCAAEWDRFDRNVAGRLNWEEAACRARGALDAGTHIMVALERQPATPGGQ